MLLSIADRFHARKEENIVEVAPALYWSWFSSVRKLREECPITVLGAFA